MEIRPIVMRFAEKMERKLRKNDYKSSYKEMTSPEILGRIEDEIAELQDAMDDAEVSGIINEAVDVANFMAMLIDKLRSKDEEHGSGQRSQEEET